MENPEKLKIIRKNLKSDGEIAKKFQSNCEKFLMKFSAILTKFLRNGENLYE